MSEKRRCSAAWRPPSRRHGCSRLSVPVNGLSLRRRGSTGRAPAHRGRRAAVRAVADACAQVAAHPAPPSTPRCADRYDGLDGWASLASGEASADVGLPERSGRLGDPARGAVRRAGHRLAGLDRRRFARASRRSRRQRGHRPSDRRGDARRLGLRRSRGRRGWIGPGSPPTSSRPVTSADRLEPWMKRCDSSPPLRPRRAGSSSRWRACGGSTPPCRRTRGCRHIVDGSLIAHARCDPCSMRYGRRFVDHASSRSHIDHYIGLYLDLCISAARRFGTTGATKHFQRAPSYV